jgi:hypothetical protein
MASTSDGGAVWAIAAAGKTTAQAAIIMERINFLPVQAGLKARALMAAVKSKSEMVGPEVRLQANKINMLAR